MKSFTTLLAAGGFIAVSFAAQSAGTTGLDAEAAAPTDGTGPSLSENVADPAATDMVNQPPCSDTASEAGHSGVKVIIDGIRYVPASSCQGYGGHGGSEGHGGPPHTLLPPQPYDAGTTTSSIGGNAGGPPGGNPPHTIATTATTSSAMSGAPSGGNDAPPTDGDSTTTTTDDTQSTAVTTGGDSSAGTSSDATSTDLPPGTYQTASTLSTVTTADTSADAGTGTATTGGNTQPTDPVAPEPSSSATEVQVKFAPGDDDGPHVNVPTDNSLVPVKEGKGVKASKMSVSVVDGADGNAEGAGEAAGDAAAGGVEGITCVAFKDKDGKNKIGEAAGVKVGETGDLGGEEVKVKAVKCGKGDAGGEDAA